MNFILLILRIDTKNLYTPVAIRSRANTSSLVHIYHHIPAHVKPLLVHAKLVSLDRPAVAVTVAEVTTTAAPPIPSAAIVRRASVISRAFRSRLTNKKKSIYMEGKGGATASASALKREGGGGLIERGKKQQKRYIYFQHVCRQLPGSARDAMVTLFRSGRVRQKKKRIVEQCDDKK